MWPGFLMEYNDIEGANKYQLVMDCEVTQFSFNPSVNAITTGTFTVLVLALWALLQWQNDRLHGRNRHHWKQ